jgi:hypothetical protein
MKEICIPLEKFDLDRFIGKILDFLKSQVTEDVDPSCAISWVESPGGCPNDGDDGGWDFRSKLLNGKAFLFFPFAFPGYEGSFECADGNCYRVLSEDEDEDDDQDFVEEDVIGYLVRVSDGSISIASAICPLSGSIPPPTIDLLHYCKELEQPMIDFIQGFIRGSDGKVEKTKTCR